MRTIYLIILLIFITLIAGCIGENKSQDFKDDLLWEHAIEAGTVSISPNGEYIFMITAPSIYIEQKSGNILFNSSYDLLLFNRNGDILWSQKFEVENTNEITQFNAFIREDNILLTTAKTTYIFNIVGKLIKKTETVANDVSLQISEDGSYVDSKNKNISVFDNRNNKKWEYKIDDNLYINSVIISNDGRYVFASTRGAKYAWADSIVGIYVFDMQGNLIRKYTAIQYPAPMAISDDGRYLVVGADKLYLFEINKGKSH